MSNDSLVAMFQRIVGVRQEVISTSSELNTIDEGTLPLRRKALLRTVVDRLRCVQDQTLPLDRLAVDPAIVALRKGVAKSLVAFVLGYPEAFKVKEETSLKGKKTQVVTLVGTGPPGTNAATMESSVAAELLVGQVITFLQAAGGSAAVSTLKQEPAIRERAKGVAAKLSKFLSNYNDVFDVVTEKDNIVCHLKGMVQVDEGQFGYPQLEGDRREALLQQVVAVLVANGGVATTSDLGMDPAIKELSKGVAAKLSRFLASRPDVFALSMGEGEKLTCALLQQPPAAPPQWSPLTPRPPLGPPPGFAAFPAVELQLPGPPSILDAATAGDPRELLLQTIIAYLQDHGGIATVSDLGQEPLVKERQRGVAAKLSKFLGQHPQHFAVQAEGERQVLVCQLLAA